MSKQERCPECGSFDVGRDDVDIGVGVLYGPLGCFDCGWTDDENDRPDWVDPLDDDDDGLPW